MASSGSAISVLQDFLLTTGISILSGQGEIDNSAMRQTFALRYLLQGKESLQGGSSIKDDIYLTIDSSAQHYGVNVEFDYRLRDILQQWGVEWRFTADHYTLTEQGVELNTGGLGAGGRHHQFKNYKKSAEQNMATSLVTLMDDDLFAQPDFAAMEAAGGLTPMSLIAFVHENNKTAISTGSDVGYAGTIPATLDKGGTAWSTIMGIDPATQAGWRNPAVGYKVIGDHRKTADLFEAFQIMYDLLNFQGLPWMEEQGKASMPNAWIAASLEGRKDYYQSLVASGDTIGATSNPSRMGMNFEGTPIVYIRLKDSATCYPTGSATGAASTELDPGNTSTPNDGPRYEFFCRDHVKKVCHSNRYFYVKPPFFPSHQPFNLVTIADIWHNNINTSRLKGGGVIHPVASIGVA